MRMRCLVCALVALLGGVLFSEDEYEVKIQRPCKAGDKWVIKGVSSRRHDQVATLGGQKQEDNEYSSMSFEGEIEILDVDQEGRPTRVSSLVEECVVRDSPSGPPRVGLAKGTKVMGDLVDGKRSFTAEGKETSREVASLLADFLPLKDASVTHSDDEVFGTKDKKRVGDSWPASADLIANGVGAWLKTGIDPKLAKGTTTLKAVEDVAGRKCMTLHVDFTVTGILPPQFSADATIQVSEFKASLEGVYPIDPASPPCAESTDYRWEFRGSTKDGQGNTVDAQVSVEQSVNKTRRPVK